MKTMTVAGMVLAACLSASSAMAANAQLEAPILVHRDQKVLVTLHDGGITVKTTVVAEQDGRAGDVIALRNPASEKQRGMTMRAEELAMLVNGLDLKQAQPRKWYRRSA